MNIGETMLGEEGVLLRSRLPVSFSDQLDFHNLGVCEIKKGGQIRELFTTVSGQVQNV